ncbi:unnamed protein product [Thelazia callipaeda]|uniref:G-patch domain-containing protein n=1 Tax=Thelazia callipaeda TaxID=103827 RepID=A0A0N5CNL9_THECL|nr:unnamed protein product [Thelazia callipaeda]
MGTKKFETVCLTKNPSPSNFSRLDDPHRLSLITTYAIVRNIPKAYHAKHLRYFFADYIENEKFHCFHYRHRPEVSSYADLPTTSKDRQRFCCVVSFDNNEVRDAFINQYHLNFWMYEERPIPLKCFIFPLKFDMLHHLFHSLSSDFVLHFILSVNFFKASVGTSKSNLDFRYFMELKPPSLMPNGNVGTPTKFFLEQIRLCKLPPSIFTKLGIKSRRRIGKYAAVEMKYENQTINVKDSVEKDQSLVAIEKVQSYAPKIVVDENFENGTGSGVNDDVECEEWERHEALHDDVTEQERTKHRKYEQEQEVTWEKGGPGLVWYTDAFFWKELEEGTDSDWKWADDWDVDYSIYYDQKDGDLDAKQALEIIMDKNLRSGSIDQTVFKSKVKKRQHEVIEKPCAIGFGEFETYTRGIGSKIMKKCGWSPGVGLGVQNSGRLETVSVELDEMGIAQAGIKRKGLGYRGEKLQRSGFIKENKHIISTMYATF